MAVSTHADGSPCTNQCQSAHMPMAVSPFDYNREFTPSASLVPLLWGQSDYFRHYSQAKVFSCPPCRGTSL